MRATRVKVANTENSSFSRGGIMHLKITDVEGLRKRVRKMVADRVLSGDRADVGLELAQMDGCRVCVCGGYGALSREPQTAPRDRLLWVLSGYAEVHAADGHVTSISQGESAVLAGGTSYRLVFPQVSVYLSVEPGEEK
jgi:uncharacterized cupin superfamily protein